MNDLIKREDAIKVISDRICDNKWVCECAINSLPTAEPQGELISKKDVVKAVTNYIWHLPNECYKNFNSYNDIEEVVTDAVKQLPSTNDNWIPVSERLPSKDGQYLVFYEGTIIGSLIEIMWYGEPLMPNVDVSGKHFYRSDSEWGDIIYDDVIAWMPLPKPYREENEE